MTKIISKIAACTFALGMSGVSAEMIVTGEISALLPTLSKTFNDAQFANIDRAEINLTVNPDSGCSIVSNRNVAKRNNLSGDLSCVFEWTNIPSGLSAGLLKASGIVKDATQRDLSYQISFFSGASEEKVVINSEDIALDLDIPSPPTLVGIQTEFSHATLEGLTPINHALNATLKEIRVRVEPREYQQRVELRGLGQCMVPANEDVCIINKNGARFGSRELSRGYSTHPVKINSMNSFFPDLEELYTIAWDYRSPVVKGFGARLHTGVANPTFPETRVAVGDNDVLVENGEAKVVITSPYDNVEDFGNLLRYSAALNKENVWVRGGTDKPVIWNSSLRPPSGFGNAEVFRFQQKGNNGGDASSLSQCIQVSERKDDQSFTLSMALRANIGSFQDNVIVRVDTGCNPGEGETGEEHYLQLLDEWQNIELTQVLNTNLNDRVSVHIYGDNSLDDGDMFFIADIQLEMGEEKSVHIPTMATPRVIKMETGDWVIPESVRITFEQSDAYINPDNGLSISRRKVVEEGEYQRKPEAFSVESDLTPEIVGDAYVYTLDVSSAENGVFTPVVYAEDKYANLTQEAMGEVKLDNKPPTIRFNQGAQELQSGDALYFPEELIIVAEDQYIGGAVVQTVMMNGEVLEIDDSKQNFVRLAEKLDLVRGDQYTFEATVVDAEGNQTTSTIDLVYMPTVFEERTNSEKAYQHVQEFRFQLLQREGRRCRYFPTREKALSGASYNMQACYLLPESTDLSVAQDSGVPTLKGVFQTLGTKTVPYKYYFVNPDGAERIATEGTLVVEVVEPRALELDLLPTPDVNEELFAVKLRGESFTAIRVTSSNGPVTLRIDTEGEETLEYNFGQRPNAEVLRNGRRISTPSGDLWERRSFTIQAFYTLKPDVQETININVVYVPNNNVRGRLESTFKEALSTELRNDTIKVGRYDRSLGDYVYDIETMGKWRGFLALREGDGTIIPITPEKELVDGIADFDVDVSSLGLGSISYVGVLNLISEVDGYTKRIITNRNYIRVWKGTQLDGGIKAFRLFGKVPFNFMGQYRPDSIDDQRVLGGVKWEITQDEVTWTPMPTGTNDRFVKQTFTEPGVWKVRAVATNKFTGEESVSESVEITAFNTPRISIIGPSVMYYGETQEFRVLDRGEEVIDTGATIEWSYDGEQWTKGSNTFAHSVSEGDTNFGLYVRMRYEDTDNVNNAAYDRARKTVSIKAPSAPRINIKGSFYSEVGKETVFTAKATSRYSGTASQIMGEWELPDGTTIPGMELRITPTDEWIDQPVRLKFTAWHDGLDSSTSGERFFTTNGWRYEFPDYNFVVRQQTKFAPSQIQIFAQRDSESYPTPIKFDTEFEPLSDMTLEYEARNSARFLADEAGIHTVKITATDSRGNSVDFIETIEVVEPEPPSIEFRASLSNPVKREPLDVIVSAGVKLQHIQDRVNTYQWFVNDVALSDTRNRANVFGLMEGTNIVKVIVTSQHGHVAEKEYVVDVVDNKRPTCEPKWTVYNVYTRVDSMCRDSDGRMTLYEWEVNGVMTGVRGSSMQYYYPGGINPENMNVRLVAYDDSNESTELSFTIDSR